ncbi:LacI family DNA-binding transcriptional regulator [Pediococcus pentosaceus]|uniref:LacI family DNA-binding transcriptional regulator n=1 Tax=Pediococcus pentosaceus TaxID=1255 RepID=UPI000852F570|nr:LacI family DNA-binding transcriptional regulator [Pediococcus pentosaceus]MCT1176979.1 LacI family transcriptional regulator [Pediococcus pentosaceus]MDE3750824.1 LacI family DNA-binding transcriptional regulator [Pediococcus pentosaceus]
MKKKVSIQDIADKAGVSKTTVSKVINNTGNISISTQKKIHAIMSEFDYQPNRLAATLKTGHTKLIGILVPDIRNEFYSKIVKKCESLLFKAGYTTIICNTERDYFQEENYLQVLKELMVEGIIIISATDSINTDLIEQNKNIVYIDRVPQSDNENIIKSDHYEGAKKAISELIKDNRDPYLIMSKTNYSPTRERTAGFKDAVQELTPIVDIQKHIFRLNVSSDKYLEENSLLEEFLIEHSTNPKPLGIFAINDYVAFMIIKTALKLHISIPEKLSVIGFDDASVANIATPTISTVHQNTTLLAEKAVNVLLTNIISNNHGKVKKITIPVAMVYRESFPKK